MSRMKIILLRLLFILLPTLSFGQKTLLVFDEFGNVILKSKTVDSMCIFKIKFEDLQESKTHKLVTNDLIHIYYGANDFNPLFLKEMCNSVFGICKNMSDSEHFIFFGRLGDIPYNEKDTLCYPTGLDSLPDGYWAKGEITSEKKIKIIEGYYIKDYKIEGQKYFDAERDTVVYKNGFIVYKRVNFSDSSYVIYKYNECGKTKETFFYESWKLKGYENSDLGIGYFKDIETGNLTDVYTIKKNVIHGKYYVFNFNGTLKRIDEFVYGKKR